MYLALYRKWRPKRFNDVIGQEHIVQTLQNQIKNNKLSHAYLFTGFRGTGKTTCAKILAKATNCPNQENGNPCNQCEICKGIDNGSIMDILEIDAASNNGVENIRELRDEANFTPSVCRYRIYIIDEVHMLSIGAFNALLKIMEEPPSYVMFILATTDVQRIPPTILSRCQQFQFNKINQQLIADRLMFIANSENIVLEPSAAQIIAHHSDGGLRDALSILDACMSLSDNNTINKNIVSNILAISDVSIIINTAKFILNRDVVSTLNIIDDITSKHIDPLRLATELIDIFKNIMIIKTTGNQIEKFDEQTQSSLKELANNHDINKIVNVLDTLSSNYDNISKSSSKQTELELSVIKSIYSSDSKNKNNNADNNSEFISLQQKIISLEAEIINLKNKLSSFNELQNSKKSKLENLISASTNTSNNEINPQLYEHSNKLEKWPEILEDLSIINPGLSVALQNSNGHINQDAGIIFVETDNPFFLELIRSSSKAKQSLKQAIFKVLGQKYRIGPYKHSKKNVNNDFLDDIETIAKQNNIDIDII